MVKVLGVGFTSEIDSISTVLELNALQRLAESLMVVTNRMFCSLTERQRKICICLLPIIIRTDCVHP